jgi:hypothetical protein
VVFTIPSDIRAAVEWIITEVATDDFYRLEKEVKSRGVGIDRDDLRLYLNLRSNYIGDLYFYVTDLEKSLHGLIRRVLISEYADDDMWWHYAIPVEVKEKCEKRRHHDKDPADHPYSYTTFLHLKDIVESNWRIFENYLPEAESADRRALVDALFAANIVRNKVMHPVRQDIPSDEEFQCVLELRDRLARRRWRNLF